MDGHLVPRPLSLVTKDTERLGHVCVPVKKVEDGQATQLHVTVRKQELEKLFSWEQLHLNFFVPTIAKEIKNTPGVNIQALTLFI